MKPPVVVHRPAPSTGGRAVTINGVLAGMAREDGDLVFFLQKAGLYDAEHLLDDPSWIEWRGGPAHRYEPP